MEIDFIIIYSMCNNNFFFHIDHEFSIVTKFEYFKSFCNQTIFESIDFCFVKKCSKIFNERGLTLQHSFHVKFGFVKIFNIFGAINHFCFFGGHGTSRVVKPWKIKSHYTLPASGFSDTPSIQSASSGDNAFISSSSHESPHESSFVCLNDSFSSSSASFFSRSLALE